MQLFHVDIINLDEMERIKRKIKELTESRSDRDKLDTDKLEELGLTGTWSMPKPRVRGLGEGGGLGFSLMTPVLGILNPIAIGSLF